MRLTFWGATKRVTGSMFLLTLDDGYQILVDCGTDMNGLSEDMPLYPGACFPFDASLVNVVLLTHAHLDHSGKIPNLYREGFEGQVLCTNPTMHLTELLLQDSASLNKKKLNKYHKAKGQGRDPEKMNIDPEVLYLKNDVEKAIDRFVPIQFDRKFNIKSGLNITFIPAGHLLGAAHILIEVEEEGETKKILFSGDIGRNDYPLHVDPQEIPEVDYLICESTYGNRRHQTIAQSTEEIEDVIKRTCVDMPGRLIIPAFSIGRTQAVIYMLHKLFMDGKLPPIKIFTDSPMAHKSNQIYEHFIHALNKEAQEFKEEHGSLFQFDTLHYILDNKESKSISNHHEPCVIISSSGMLEGGRIQHHINANMQNPYCTVLMVGYSAEGTFGHRLLNANGALRVGSKELAVHCNIEKTDSFSGHGDVDDLIAFVKTQSQDTLKQMFLVHGDESSMIDFKESLAEKGYQNIELPEKGQTYLL